MPSVRTLVSTHDYEYLIQLAQQQRFLAKLAKASGDYSRYMEHFVRSRKYEAAASERLMIDANNRQFSN